MSNHMPSITSLNKSDMMTDAEKIFDRRRKTFGLFAGPVLGLIVYFMPIAGLKWDAHALLAILTFCATWWLTEAVPIPVSCLLGPLIAAMIGVASPTAAFAAFANPLIFLFMGSFMIAKAMTIHGLDKRIAYGMLSLKWVGSSPPRILLVFGIVTALISGWVSDTATTAMMYPIGMGLLVALRDMQVRQGKQIDLSAYKYATGLMLMAAYASAAGGVLTPVGTAPNILAMGLLEQIAHIKISFFDWMIWGVPMTILYFAVVYIVLLKMFPADVRHIEGAEEFIREKRTELGKISVGERNAIIAFVMAVILWVLPGPLEVILGRTPFVKAFQAIFPEALVAMMGGILLFLLPVNWQERRFTLNWREANEGIEWGTLLLFGGGLSLGGMMYSTGLAKWLGQIIVAYSGAHSSVAMIALFSTISLFMAELTSHTATTNMVAPLGITTAMAAGLNPVPIAISIAIASSLGFMMPISSPPTAIVFGSGLVPFTRMVKAGITIDIIGLTIVTIPVMYYVSKWMGFF